MKIREYCGRMEEMRIDAKDTVNKKAKTHMCRIVRFMIDYAGRTWGKL